MGQLICPAHPFPVPGGEALLPVKTFGAGWGEACENSLGFGNIYQPNSSEMALAPEAKP